MRPDVRRDSTGLTMREAMKKYWQWWKRPWRTSTPPSIAVLRAHDDSQARPWDAIYEQLGVPRTLRYPRTTLGRLLDQTADRFPDAPAMFYGDTRCTYGQLLQQVNRLSGGLAHLGVRKGDRVLMTLPNCPEFITSFFAVQKLGAVVVNAGPLMGFDDLRRLVELTEPRLLIGLDLQGAILARLSDQVPRMCVSLRGYQTALRRLGYRYKLWQETRHNSGPACQLTFEKLLEEAPARTPSLPSEPADLAVLQPTGGTTGTLKVAQLSHHNLLANATQVSVWGSLRDGQEIMLGLLPMFHAYGLTMSLIAPVLVGGTMLPQTRFRMDLLLEAIRRHRPTVVPLVPAILHAVCDELERHPRPEICDVLRHAKVLSGAAALAGSVAHRFEQLTGASIMQGYGLTEASPVTHSNPPRAGRTDSIGVPLPDTLTRVADLHDETLDAPAGEPGELLISGPQIFSGYYRDAEQTTRVLATDAGGRVWLRTGDVVRVDADGFFYVVDRRKDMINRGGEKVWPARVERVLAMHPQVLDSAVIGRPDGLRGERVVAIVAVRSPLKDYEPLIAELNALCREHLGRHEIPTHFEFTDRVPRSELGKLLKYRLREPPPPSQAA
jgi:long-chain acyl-CoA synthetase